MGFRETRPELLTDNPFKLIGADWMLITAGTPESLKIPVANGSGSSILKEEGYPDRSLTPQKAAENSLAPGFDTMTASWGGLGVLAESRLVLACRKIYSQDISPERFCDPRIEGMYPEKDYHRMYIGEIVQCLVQGT